MAWIDSGYVDNLIGSTQRTAVAPTSTVFNQFEASARVKVIAVMLYAGYPSPGETLTAGTDTTAFLQLLASAQWVREAYGNRKGIKAPPAVDDAFNLLAAVYEKRIPIPGLTPTSTGGYGGSRFSRSSGTAPRPQQFSRSKIGSM